LAWNCEIVLLGPLACGSFWALQGTVDDPGSSAAARLMLAEPAATSVAAGVVTFDAANIRGSRLSESIFAGMITDIPMVIAVMTTAAVAKATRGTEGS